MDTRRRPAPLASNKKLKLNKAEDLRRDFCLTSSLMDEVISSIPGVLLHVIFLYADDAVLSCVTMIVENHLCPVTTLSFRISFREELVTEYWSSWSNGSNAGREDVVDVHPNRPTGGDNFISGVELLFMKPSQLDVDDTATLSDNGCPNFLVSNVLQVVRTTFARRSLDVIFHVEVGYMPTDSLASRCSVDVSLVREYQEALGNRVAGVSYRFRTHPESLASPDLVIVIHLPLEDLHVLVSDGLGPLITKTVRSLAVQRIMALL